MRQDELTRLMHRSIDGELAPHERESLSRAVEANPLFKAQYDELATVHTATERLFEQIALPPHFSRRVMQRLQGANVPADIAVERVRLPGRRSIRRRRASLERMRRRQARLYGAAAVFSAAAALTLAVGIVTGAFSSPTADHEQVTVGAVQGGPGTRGDNRTDPLSPDVEEGEALRPSRDDGASPDSAGLEEHPGRTEPGPQPTVRKHEPEAPKAMPPAIPTHDESDDPAGDEPADDGFDLPEPAPAEPAAPAAPAEEPAPHSPSGDDIDRNRGPHSRASASASDRKIGSLSVLSGRLELQGPDGAWVRLPDGSAIPQDASLRTNVNGVAVLTLNHTTVVLGRGTEVTLTDDDAALLVSGEVSIDRASKAEGGEFELTCGDYRLTLAQGCALVTRKRQSLQVRVATGSSLVEHAQLGGLTLEGGFETDIAFDKPYSAPRQSRIILPDWSGKARAGGILAAIDPALMARDWKLGERRYVDRTLASNLERVMRHPVNADEIVSLLSAAIGNVNLDGRSLCQLVSEIESILIEETNFTNTHVLTLARVAATNARDLNDWQMSFRLLLYPPVPRPAHGDDCPPDNDRHKRDRHPRGAKPAHDGGSSGPVPVPVPAQEEPRKRDGA